LPTAKGQELKACSLNRLFVDALNRWVEDSLEGLEWFRFDFKIAKNSVVLFAKNSVLLIAV
jgi:hypothetical protein